MNMLAKRPTRFICTPFWKDDCVCMLSPRSGYWDASILPKVDGQFASCPRTASLLYTGYSWYKILSFPGFHNTSGSTRTSLLLVSIQFQLSRFPAQTFPPTDFSPLHLQHVYEQFMDRIPLVSYRLLSVHQAGHDGVVEMLFLSERKQPCLGFRVLQFLWPQEVPLLPSISLKMSRLQGGGEVRSMWALPLTHCFVSTIARCPRTQFHFRIRQKPSGVCCLS